MEPTPNLDGLAAALRDDGECFAVACDGARLGAGESAASVWEHLVSSLKESASLHRLRKAVTRSDVPSAPACARNTTQVQHVDKTIWCAPRMGVWVPTNRYWSI